MYQKSLELPSGGFEGLEQVLQLMNEYPEMVNAFDDVEDLEYRILDDRKGLQIWLVVDNETRCIQYGMTYRSEQYNSLCFKYWNCEKTEDEDKDYLLARMEFQTRGTNIPLNVCIVDPTEIESDDVQISLSASTVKVNFFETKQEIKEFEPHVNQERIIPLGTFEDDPRVRNTSLLFMRGKILKSAIETNGLTGNKYGRFTVESLGMQMTVLVPEEKLPERIEQKRYISGIFMVTGYIKSEYMEEMVHTGNLVHISFEEPVPENVFEEKIIRILKNMRDLKNEALVIELGDLGKELEDFFIQACILEIEQGKKHYVVEYGKKTPRKRFLYRLKADDAHDDLEHIRQVFKMACMERKEPLLWDWKDVSFLMKNNGKL